MKKILNFKNYFNNTVKNYYLYYIIFILFLVMQFVFASLALRFVDFQTYNTESQFLIVFHVITLLIYAGLAFIFSIYFKNYRKRIKIYRAIGASNLSISIYIVFEFLLLIGFSLLFGFLFDHMFNDIFLMDYLINKATIGKFYGFTILSVVIILLVLLIVSLILLFIDNKNSYGSVINNE